MNCIGDTTAYVSNKVQFDVLVKIYFNIINKYRCDSTKRSFRHIQNDACLFDLM